MGKDKVQYFFDLDGYYVPSDEEPEKLPKHKVGKWVKRSGKAFLEKDQSKQYQIDGYGGYF